MTGSVRAAGSLAEAADTAGTAAGAGGGGEVRVITKSEVAIRIRVVGVGGGVGWVETAGFVWGTAEMARR